MRRVVESIIRKDFVEARKNLDEAVALIMEKKLFEMKKRMMAEMDTSKMTPVPASDIEDRRPTQTPVQSGKGDKQVAGSNQTIVPKNNIKEVVSGSGGYRTKDGKYIPYKSYEKMGQDVRKKKNSSDIALRDDDEKNKNNIKEDEEQLDEARIKIVRARIRGGKVQRRKKVSNVPGMTLRGGTLKRMSPAERRRRKLGQRKGKIKRKSKMTQTLMKRKRSLRKRKTLGI